MTLTFDYDIQTRLSVFPVNLAQIRSAVAEIFHTQKSHRQRQKTEPYVVHCVRAVITTMATHLSSQAKRFRGLPTDKLDAECGHFEAT